MEPKGQIDAKPEVQKRNGDTSQRKPATKPALITERPEQSSRSPEKAMSREERESHSDSHLLTFFRSAIIARKSLPPLSLPEISGGKCGTENRRLEGRGRGRPSEIHGDTGRQREERLRKLNSLGFSLAGVPVCAVSCWGGRGCKMFLEDWDNQIAMQSTFLNHFLGKYVKIYSKTDILVLER